MGFANPRIKRKLLTVDAGQTLLRAVYRKYQTVQGDQWRVERSTPALRFLLMLTNDELKQKLADRGWTYRWDEVEQMPETLSEPK